MKALLCLGSVTAGYLFLALSASSPVERAGAGLSLRRKRPVLLLAPQSQPVSPVSPGAASSPPSAEGGLASWRGFRAARAGPSGFELPLRPPRAPDPHACLPAGLALHTTSHLRRAGHAERSLHPPPRRPLGRRSSSATL